MYTKEELKQQLQNAGFTGKETILIHSSMKAIGEVEGGADTVLDAWMEYFAEGLLLLPTHTWANVNPEHTVLCGTSDKSVPAEKGCGALSAPHPFAGRFWKRSRRISGRRGRAQYPMYPGRSL